MQHNFMPGQKVKVYGKSGEVFSRGVENRRQYVEVLLDDHTTAKLYDGDIAKIKAK